MIRAVIFDWGGVMSPAGTPDEAAQNFAGKIGLDQAEAARLLSLGAHKLKRGEISEEEFWNLIAAEHGSSIDQTHRNIWVDPDKFKPTPEMSRLVEDVKASGRKVAVLSNTFPASAEAIRVRGWYEPFDVVLLSSDEGMAKPDEDFYVLALKRLNIKPEEALFIDDQQRCLNPAEGMGVTCVRADNQADTIRQIRAILHL